MTKSGTGMWDLGSEALGAPGRGTWGHWDTGTWGRGTRDVGTPGHVTRGHEDGGVKSIVI